MASRPNKAGRVVKTLGGTGAEVIGIEVVGVEHAMGVLDNFSERALKNKFRKAMRRVGNDLRNAARAEAPRSGRGGRSKLYRSIQVKPLAVGGISIGPSAPHRFLVIRGTGPRYTKGGAYRGIMPSNPFMDRAIRPMLGLSVLGAVRDEVLKR